MADNLTETLQTRLSKSQLDEVKDAASLAGLSVSAYLRFAVLREARRGD